MNPDLSQHLLCIEKILEKDCAFVCLVDQQRELCEILSMDPYSHRNTKEALALKTDYLKGIASLLTGDRKISVFYEKDHGFPGLVCYAASIYGENDGALYILLAFCKHDAAKKNVSCLMEVAAYCMGRELVHAAEIEDLERRNELLVRQRENFVDSILIFAHETKNSISSLSAYIQLLKLNMNANGRAKADKMLGQIAEINDIIGQLVNWGRTNKLEAAKVSINQQIATISELMQDRANLRGINLKINMDDEPLYANIDTTMMDQVFMNIMDNAFAAMEHGGKLEVTVEGDIDRKIITIIFKDNGCGIPAENKNKLFELFFTTKANGSGLGLSLCNNIISVHGGTIEVDSQEGKGTIFKINLPMVV